MPTHVIREFSRRIARTFVSYRHLSAGLCKQAASWPVPELKHADGRLFSPEALECSVQSCPMGLCKTLRRSVPANADRLAAAYENRAPGTQACLLLATANKASVLERLIENPPPTLK
jgi:hypothetical protein